MHTVIDLISSEIIGIYEVITRQNDKYMLIWKEDIFLTWRWWICVGIFILPWIAWIFLRKKESTDRLLYAGLSVYVITSIFDSAGMPFGLWCYIITPIPYIHTFCLPWDLTIMPVATMLLIQYKPAVSPYLKGLIFALGGALVIEPLATWLKFYQPLNWKYIYSVPIYFVIYIIAHHISKRNNFARIK